MLAAASILLSSGGCVYSIATPDWKKLEARYEGYPEGLQMAKKRKRRRRGIWATVLGPLEIGAASALVYAVASGLPPQSGEHAPEDRWSGAAEDTGKTILAYVFFSIVAAYLGVSGIGDTVCGIGDLVFNRECNFNLTKDKKHDHKSHGRKKLSPIPSQDASNTTVTVESRDERDDRDDRR